MNNLKRYTLYILNAVDIVSCFLAYGLALLVRTYFIRGFIRDRADYAYFLMTVLVAYFIVNFLLIYKDDKYLHRNSLNELTVSIKMSVFVMTLVVLYFNFAKISINYSRIFEAIYTVSLILIDFFLRVTVKKLLISKRLMNFNTEKVLLIASESSAREFMKKMSHTLDWRYHIEKIFITNDIFEDKAIDEIPAVLSGEDMFSEETLNSVDGVIILPGDEKDELILEWMNVYKTFGKSVHVQIPEYELSHSYRSLDNIGDIAMVTYRDLQPMSIRQQLFKRVFDILFSLVLLPVYVLFYLIVKIFTTFEAPGPVLVRRVRMGRNSRRFYQYRFRTYRTDALEREAQGKSPYTFIGKIINALHIDGFPEILNVLAGDMSFVGPKAPNVPKYLNMSVRERNLLSIKPGIIGYWTGEQDPIKALSDETDYLENWNFIKDVSVILYCTLRYISLHSLRVHGDTHTDEEYAFVREIREHYEPVAYDASLYHPKSAFFFDLFKRVFDFLVCLPAVLVLSPVYLILTILVIADDGGAPFYTHERVGKNGKKIYLYKFRSMREDAGKLEELLTPEQLDQYKREFKIDDDPRITPVGDFLRRSSLDEIPQLFNILRGDMSLIGPRPIVEDELFKNYTDEEIARLLSVKPGLTGYWQAYARNDAEYEDHKRQDMELYYVENRSLLLDIKVFFKTIGSVLSQRGVK